MAALASVDLDALCALDTPTICNALEIATPERRAYGFNRRPLIAPIPATRAVVGYARTATIRAREPQRRSREEARALRLKYYAHVAQAPLPSLVVMQDVDGPDRGFGAFWGEVQSNVHKALGCLGTITNGSIRDIPAIAPGFQMLAGSIVPSHAYVRVVDFAVDVIIHGMAVKSHDLIHADRHGAVVVPPQMIAAMQAAAEDLSAREAKIIAATRRPGVTVADIKAAMKG